MQATKLEITYKLDEASATALVRMLGKLVAIEEKLMGMQEEVAALNQKVSELGTTAEAAVTLLAALKSSGGDPAAIKAVADQIGAINTALSTAVAANTPAA